MSLLGIRNIAGQFAVMAAVRWYGQKRTHPKKPAWRGVFDFFFLDAGRFLFCFFFAMRL